MWSNIWKCPPVNGGTEWWCGNETETTACQIGINASFISYTSGSILGFPPLTSSPSAITQSIDDPVTTTFSVETDSGEISVSTSSSSYTSTSPSLSAQNPKQSISLPTDPSMPASTQKHSTSLPTAMGAGIGIPLGMAILGFLGFLFWKNAVRQRKSRPQILSQEIGSKKDVRVGAATLESPRNEMHNIQFPRELNGQERSELHSSEIIEI